MVLIEKIENRIFGADADVALTGADMAEDEEYDVIILGGGPSGSSTAAFLAKAGKKVLLLDKAKFPREKTCGDGISGRSVGVLRELGILEEFKKVEHQDMYGVTFSSPNGTVVPVSAPKTEAGAPGFVCRREVFDNVLFQYAKRLCTRTIEGFVATDLITDLITTDAITDTRSTNDSSRSDTKNSPDVRVVGVKGRLDGKDVEFRAKVLVGADGAGGITARKLGAYNNDENHQCAAIRCYYEGVEGMIDQIELHFVDGVIPGYFWIFPLPNKRANVGIGMLVKDMKKTRVNLQKLLFDVVEKNPVFRARFKNAKRITEIKSWILPYASKRVKMFGNGYVLVGDAASLIDPFTGEGIGNSLTSGKCASKVILDAFEQGDFSEKTFSEYPKMLWGTISGEVNANYRLQNLANHKFLLDVMIGKAKRSKLVRDTISDALINPQNHGKLVDPLFFLRVLLA